MKDHLVELLFGMFLTKVTLKLMNPTVLYEKLQIKVQKGCLSIAVVTVNSEI